MTPINIGSGERERLRELATGQAQRLHDDASDMQWDANHPKHIGTLCNGHSRPMDFATCPHPDCALVREAPPVPEPIELRKRNPPRLTVRDALLLFGQHEKQCASHLSTNELRQYCDCYFGTCLAWYAMPHPNGPDEATYAAVEARKLAAPPVPEKENHEV